jgi:hypothetical protein
MNLETERLLILAIIGLRFLKLEIYRIDLKTAVVSRIVWNVFRFLSIRFVWVAIKKQLVLAHQRARDEKIRRLSLRTLYASKLTSGWRK